MDNLTLNSQISKVYELRTRLSADKANYELLAKQYAALIKIVEAADNQDELPTDFLSSIKNSQDQIVKELPNLAQKIAYLNILIEQHETEADPTKTATKYYKVEDVVTLLFTAMGINDGANTEEPAPEQAE